MSQDQTELLFSYGTLQLADVQMAQFGRWLDGQADAMPGYGRTMLEITDPEVIRKSGSNWHPIVTATGNPTEEVAGQVFAITPAELAAADAYEVDDYKRVLVPLKSGRQAWVYVRA